MVNQISCSLARAHASLTGSSFQERSITCAASQAARHPDTLAALSVLPARISGMSLVSCVFLNCPEVGQLLEAAFLPTGGLVAARIVAKSSAENWTRSCCQRRGWPRPSPGDEGQANCQTVCANLIAISQGSKDQRQDAWLMMARSFSRWV